MTNNYNESIDDNSRVSLQTCDDKLIEIHAFLKLDFSLYLFWVSFNVSLDQNYIPSHASRMA